MFWKRLTPIVLAVAVLASVSSVVPAAGPARDCWPTVERHAL